MIPLNRATLNKANQVMTQVHPGIALRSLDAIHAASADLCQQLPLRVEFGLQGAATRRPPRLPECFDPIAQRREVWMARVGYGRLAPVHGLQLIYQGRVVSAAG